jgi:hypothetical protein
MIRTIKQIKLKSGDYGRWDYNSLQNLPDIAGIASDKIDTLQINFNQESQTMTISNPSGSLDSSIDFSRVIRSGELTSVELTGTNAIGTPGMYLKFTWVTGDNSNITYADVSNLYRAGAGIIFTQAVNEVGKTISIDAAYIQELVRTQTTESIESYVTQAIDEARQRWLEL